MNCKFCGAEMDEGMNYCPKCGADNRQAAEPAAQIKEGKMTPGKIALLVVLAVVAVAAVIALVLSGLGENTGDPANKPLDNTEAPSVTDGTEAVVTEATIPADGNPDDVTCKGSYTVTDEEMSARLDHVVATMAGSQLTNRRLQVYYWMEFYNFLDYYGSYAQWIGLDYTADLDKQVSLEETMTWQQYFLDSAIGSWQCYEALCMKAEEAGYVLPEEYQQILATLKEDMDASAIEAGYESAEAMLQEDMGIYVTMDEYANYLSRYYLGYLYYADVIANTEVTDAEVEAYFDENAETFAKEGVEKDDSVYVDVRHILVFPEGGTTGEDGNTTYSDAEWEACRQEAQKILDQWLAGDADEDSFAALANELSEDTGSNTNGGLYEQVYEGEMVPEFNDWCFDTSRQYGDYDLVRTTYGYHIMFYVGSERIWYASAYEALLSELSTEMLESTLAEYPMEVDYSAIALGDVDLSAAATVTE